MKLFRLSFLLAIFAAILFSCSKEEIDPHNEVDGKKIYKLSLNASHNGYDNTTTKTNDYQWPDGAKLYIAFSNGKTGSEAQEFFGSAIYNATDKSWTLPAPQGELVRGDSTACKVVYIENVPDGEIISLSSDNVIYEDLNAEYFLGTETLTITTELSPKTARIRFKGAANSTIKIYGTAHYTSFNTTYNTFASSDKELEVTVGSDGYTPYLHVYFPNTVRRLELTDNNNKIYIFKCSGEHLATGTSRYFDIPTVDALKGWKVYDPVRTFKIKDVEFKMIYVQYISGSFYIAETETTQKLWFAVTNTKPFTFSPYKENLDTLGNVISTEILDLPAESVSASEINEFLASISNLTGQSFGIPKFHQWLHAAKGGNKSQGFRYSGSNTLSDVAYMGSATGPVKSKQPNELGLYDMTGNVFEAAINSNGNMYSYGGGYDTSNTDYLVLSSSMYDSYMERNHSGLRICINL